MKKIIAAAILSLSMLTACSDTDTVETSAEVTTASQAETEETTDETTATEETANTTEETTAAEETTVTETQTAAENADHIIIKGKEYSASLTELNLVELKLTDEDIKDLDKMTNLEMLDLGTASKNVVYKE